VAVPPTLETATELACPPGPASFVLVYRQVMDPPGPAPKNRSAAIFDLDRTLLAGASGPIISAALRSVGLLGDRPMPGEDLLFRVFNLVGENRPSMILTRQGARLAAGWDRAKAREAGRRAAEKLVTRVQPYGRVLVEEHKAAGRITVLATTTPLDMVEPFAEALGIDEVVATTYDVRDGAYTGTIDGEFVWGRGKLRAVRAWAERAGVDLAESYAYSDSWYDTALLAAVGHPVAVNPDPRLRVYSVARRWPVQFLDVPPGVPKFLGLEPQKMIFPFARPELVLYAKLDIDGIEHIPDEGPGIICGNHRSYFDPLAIGYAIAKRGRPVRFLGKKEVFDAPVVGDIARAMGGIRVDRGTGSDEPLHEAALALEAGELVAIMPQGTIPRGRAFFDPELKGRWGAARLAAMAKVPVIPLGLWGTEKVWPRNEKVPRVWNVTSPPHVQVRLGPPIELDHLDPDADTARIMAGIRDLLPPEAHEQREPTRDELMATLPSSYKGEPDDWEREEARRPGVD
jgi:putative phosphoserine phosphatase / 1-acylglycerol-3-phosphate O-acyltransferase